MNLKSLLVGIFILFMLSAPASATIFDDIGSAINNIIYPQPASIIGSQTVSCADGTTSCAMSGEIFTIQSDVIASDQALKLTIPAGQSFTLSDRTVKTTQPVTLTLTPRTPYMTKPMVVNNNEFKYILYSPPFQTTNYLTAYTPYGDAVITTRYAIQLYDKYGSTATQEVSYNFNNPSLKNTVNIVDNAGITGQVIAKNQLMTGMVFDIGYAIVVADSNGVGGYSIFDRTDFKRYFDDEYDIEFYRLDYWNMPTTWDIWLSRMKNLGLKALPIGYGPVPYSFSGTSLKVNYEERHVGTSVEARFPKTMVSYVEELLFSGIPRISSMTLSPDIIKMGMGDVTASVDVYNDGSTDVFTVGIPSDNGFTSQTLSTNDVKLNNGEHYVFMFRISPTASVTSDTNYAVKAIATAQGSGIAAQVTKYFTLQPQAPVDEMQEIIITAYRPDGTALSNAPIIVNGITKGQGFWKGNLAYNTYYVSTNNNSNPTLYAPATEKVVLSGGEPVVVSLFFTTTPPNPDNSWILTLVVAIVAIIIAVQSKFLEKISKNPIALIALIVILVLSYYILSTILDISNTINSIVTLGGWLK